LPYFDPEHFLIKLTPLNPTLKAKEARLSSAIDPHAPRTARDLVQRFEAAGYRVILSIGEVEENAIGSNCGQYVTCVREANVEVRKGYTSERYA
jgi:23S rRNA (adenine2503-C2)-methyltransferase